MVKIFIDPGHGGTDPGAVANGLKEKDICLHVSLKLRDILQKEFKGLMVKLSRTEDRTLPLRERTRMANRWKADYLVSIHINAGGGQGFESYVYNGLYRKKQETVRLQQKIHRAIVNRTEFTDRGRKEANFHMLRESAMPALLTESGFIDHREDAEHLKTAAFLNKIARGHAEGIGEAFGLKVKRKTINNKNRIHIAQQGDTLWKIAKTYHVTLRELLQLNEGIEPERLQIGQEVIVKASDQPATHTVHIGDTLWQIAQSNNITVKELVKLNDGVDPKHLQIGMKLRLR
ncbi:N-acetylmuramoyl-L-alanine amidase [Virgibacillus sp. W0181]|uniref:N-acetylmuramoyl-L-alanine amidase n=1 Tax=Virgibacillus sp. W0181 TaxID=3391581 RepID=UPI003F44A002